jgi:hypothetical protein
VYGARGGFGDGAAARAIVAPAAFAACLAATTYYGLYLAAFMAPSPRRRWRRPLAAAVRSCPLWLGVLFPLVAPLPVGAIMPTVLGVLLVLAVGIEATARSSTPATRDAEHDEMLSRGYRLRWDLFVATWAIVITAIVVDTSSSPEQTRSLLAVAASASLIALYWNAYAAFESDHLLSRSEQSKALFNVAFIAVPLLLSGRTNRVEYVVVAVTSAALFVAMSERWRRIGAQRHRDA